VGTLGAARRRAALALETEFLDEHGFKRLGGSVKLSLAMAFYKYPRTIATACGLDATTQLEEE
jgi:hypothetical protein